MNIMRKLIVLLGIISSFSAPISAFEKAFFTVVDIICDTDRPYYQRGFNPISKDSFGYILKMTVNGHEIPADTQVRDPENPEKYIYIPALVNAVLWDGQPTEPINLEARISPKARASLLEALCSSAGKPKIEAEWSVYSYDYEKGKFFRSFHTNDQPIHLTFRDRFNIRQELDRYIERPLNFIFYTTLTPPPGYADQTLFVAFKSEGKTFQFPIRNESE